jgi:hypothetical protein
MACDFRNTLMDVSPANENAPRPWFREPFVWLVIGIHLSAVIVGMVMLWLSIVSFDGLVADDYYKKGMQIDRVLDRERAAAAMQLAGEFSIGVAGDSSSASSLILDSRDSASEFKPPERIEVNLSYATRAGLDRSFTMIRRGQGQFDGPALSLPAGRWYVHVGTQDWRLNGVLTIPGDHMTQLVP